MINYDVNELEDYLSSKERDRNEYEKPEGWSKWVITNRGEEEQGRVRWFNTKNSISLEPLKQLVFSRGSHYRALMQGDYQPIYLVYNFETPELAKWMVEASTEDNGFDLSINNEWLTVLMNNWKEKNCWDSLRELKATLDYDPYGF